MHKVRFVAATLLNPTSEEGSSSDGGSGVAAPGEGSSGGRLSSYLWDFLSILSEIEKVRALHLTASCRGRTC